MLTVVYWECYFKSGSFNAIGALTEQSGKAEALLA